MTHADVDESCAVRTPMRAPYERAARARGSRLAALYPSEASGGYWLDAKRFFYGATAFETVSPTVVTLPAVADMVNEKSGPLLSFAALVDIVGVCTRGAVGPESLATARFDMNPAGELMVTVQGKLFTIDLERRQATAMPALCDRPALYSPDGRHACFVKSDNVWLQDRDTGTERQLSAGGVEHCRFGHRSESSRSAIADRSRCQPIGIWSPDSHWFVTHRIDERCLPGLPLVQNVAVEGAKPRLHSFKFACPGDPLPKASIVAFDVIAGREVTFDDWPVPISIDSPFVLGTIWFDAPNALSMLRLDRFSRRVELVRLDLKRGAARLVYGEDACSGYIDLNADPCGLPNVVVLAETDEFVWYSERDGWGHLYLYDDATGTLKNRITQGDWVVRDIVDIDESRRELLILAAGLNPDCDPAQRWLCAIGLDGAGFRVIASDEADCFVPASRRPEHRYPFQPQQASAGVSPDTRQVVVQCRSPVIGDTTQIIELSTGRSHTIAATRPRETHPKARPFRAMAADGVTPLHGLLIVPSTFDASVCYPLVDYIYPGPQTAHVPQSLQALWASPAFALAELGFVTLMLDTRGLPGRSKAFHQHDNPALLEPQLADHAAVIAQLCEDHEFLDPKRVGALGQSAGGSAVVRAMCDYPKTFHVGAAVCGVHDPQFYAAAWSDKYLGPMDAEMARRESNLTRAAQLRGKLLLMSGDLDENVHLAQTLAMADALIAANRDFDLLIIPNAGHDVLETSEFAQRRIWDFFVRELLGKAPPKNFDLRHVGSRLASPIDTDLPGDVI